LQSDADTDTQTVYVRPGFEWRAANAYLFDIDGTLLNTRDGVHYGTFTRAFREVWGVDETIDGVPWHGNTDIGIIRAVAARAGIGEDALRLPEVCRWMGDELQATRAKMTPDVCPAIAGILAELREQGKLLGVATGNIESVGWAKLENCGLRDYFSLGAFSGPGCETREEIFERGVAAVRGKLGSGAVIHIIGDTPADIRGARHVGCPVVAVATGKYELSELRALAPDMALASFAELARPMNR